MGKNKLILQLDDVNNPDEPLEYLSDYGEHYGQYDHAKRESLQYSIDLIRFGGNRRSWRQGARVKICAEFIDFETTAGEPLSKPRSFYCHCRGCQIDQRAKVRRCFALALERVPSIIALLVHKPRWIVLGLTQRNVPLSELREELRKLSKGWKRFIDNRLHKEKFPAVGWVRSVEVTRELDNDYAHPHYHVLMCVPEYYFQGSQYINHDKWAARWAKSLQIDYKPSVFVRAVPRGEDNSKAWLEVLKYETKPDNVENGEWRVKLFQQLRSTKHIIAGGIFRRIFVEDKKYETKDMFPEDAFPELTEEEPQKQIKRFNWKKLQKRYKLGRTF